MTYPERLVAQYDIRRNQAYGRNENAKVGTSGIGRRTFYAASLYATREASRDERRPVAE